MLVLRGLVVLTLLSASVSGQGLERYRVPRSARPLLQALGADAHHGAPGEDYEVVLTAEQVARLQALGLRPVRVDDGPARPTAEGGGYTSYGQMRADFVAYAANHPTIARFEVLGSSVQGRDVFGLRISGNVAIEEDEPELVVWGAIHGDEFASGEVPYLWALALCDGYGSDPTITQHVDANEIWVIPLVNPDGYVAGTRQNANGVDLNRDYGFQWDGWGGSPEANSQPETRAIHDFLTAGNVTASVTMHCSGDVLFHPWGFSPNPAPDQAIITQIGSVYSSLSGYPLINSWTDYETHGELLDHVYGAHGGLCYTAELSNSLAQLPLTYARNRDALAGLLDWTGSGLSGQVTAADTGLPLEAAVWIAGNPVPCYTDPTVGDVHRLLPGGTYDVTVRANGYLPETVTGLVVAAGGAPATRFQVALQPGGTSHALRIAAVDQKDPGNAYANLTPPGAALGAPDGVACSLGSNGFIVLDVGRGNEIVDGPGDDFTVVEDTSGGDAVPELFSVLAGDAFDQAVPVGPGSGTTSFDLAAAGLTSVRYLRIVDRSGAPAADPFAGVELDALVVHHGAEPGNAYCTAKVNSLGCTPTITFGGGVGLTAATPAEVGATNVLNQRNGLFFYGFGWAALPFQGGTLCVAPPLRRTAIQSSGGSPPPTSDCSGTYAFDLNAWIQGGNDAALGSGAVGYGQYWSRDPQHPDGTGAGLTDACAFVVGP